jgi:putative spermidine/putrescine transport system permease protein
MSPPTLALDDGLAPGRAAAPRWTPPRLAAQDGLLWGTAALLAACYLLPLAGVVALSVLVPSPGLGNYVAVLSNPTVHTVVGNTLWISALTVSLTLLLAFTAATALLQATPARRRVILACVLLPLWISVLIRNYAWIAVLGPGGIVNTALLSLGVLDEPVSFVRNTAGVVIGMVHYMLPYAILPIYAQMTRIDPAVLHVARSLGASPAQAFVRVFLPLTRPGVAAAGFLVSIMSLGFYLTPAILGGGKTVMVAEFISVQVSETLRWDIATTLSTLLLIVTGSLVWRYSHMLELATAAPKS